MDEWHFTEQELKAWLHRYITEQIALCEQYAPDKKERAVCNVRLVTQRIAQSLKSADELKLGRTVDIQLLDINKMEDFKVLIGLDWSDIK
jgi:hypothetical protein